ncbi:MAG: DUF3526 domain-containing protein [Myxococcota bacterium]
MRTILFFESRLLRAGSTPRITVAFFAVAVVYALAHGLGERGDVQAQVDAVKTGQEAKWKAYRSEARELEAKRAAEGEPLDAYGSGPRSPYFVSKVYGVHIAAEPSALSALAVGQRDLYPAAHKVAAGHSVALSSSDALRNPVALAAGHFDFAFVLLYLMPLLVLALCYDLTASERESGTLRMVMAQPLALRTLIGGKVFVRAGLVVAMVTVACVAGFLLAGSVDPSRFALWLSAALLYAGFWFALSVVVNALGRSAAANAMALATAWLVFVALIPTVVNAAASTLYPMPSRSTFVAAMRTEDESIRRMEDAARQAFMADHPELTDNADEQSAWVTASVVRDELTRKRLQPLIDRYAIQRDHQQSLLARLELLSPTLLTHSLLHDIAGTSSVQQRAHIEQIEAFQGRWQAHFLPFLFENRPVNAADYASLPQFQPTVEPTSAVAKRWLGSGAILAGLVVLLSLLGIRLYSGYSLVD